MKIQVAGLDKLRDISIIAIIFTVVDVTGLANAYNIIDSFNDIAIMVAMISLLGISYWHSKPMVHS